MEDKEEPVSYIVEDPSMSSQVTKYRFYAIGQVRYDSVNSVTYCYLLLLND